MMRLKLAPALVLLALLAGCAGLRGDLEPPEVGIADVAFEEMGLFEQALRVDLRVHNPNNATLRARGVRFDLEVDGRRFARGSSAEGFTVPRLGETVVPVRVRVPTAELFERMMALGTLEPLDYQLRGELLLDPFGRTELPFTQDGTLRLPRLPGMPMS